MPKLHAALLNSRLLNFDSRFDYQELRRVVELRVMEETTTEQIAAAAVDCEVLITKEMKVTPAAIAAITDPRRGVRVRLICEAGTGYNNISLEAATKAGITVCNVPGYSTAAVAQLTMSFVLGIASGTMGYVRRTAQGNRVDFGGAPASPFEVQDKVLGVIGPGTIGSQVVARARAFGMQVLTHSRAPRQWSDAAVRSVTLDELLADSDFVSLHCPLIASGPDSTENIIHKETLARMKSSAWLINTSRGGLVNEDDLVAALRDRGIGGAVLDVQHPEPPDPNSPLWGFDNVFLTPHVGWKATEARRRLLQMVAGNIEAFAAGAPIHVVNPVGRSS